MQFIRYINLAALAGVLYVNYLANAKPINGLNTGEISDMYPSLFTPAGITFAIWGVIYLLLLAFVIYAAANRYSNDTRINALFLVTCICNMAWIFAWHYLQTGLSVLIMLLFLVALIAIYRVLPSREGKPFWFVRVPFSVYLAWICVATVANISAWLIDMSFNPSFGQVITAVMIITLLAILYIIQQQQRNWAFSLVVIWALVGILLARTWDQHMLIMIPAGAGIIFAAWTTIRAKFSPVQ
ncbi:MAG: tryptophan-rich sensory protein [Cyclobacteriaceae bacterium]